MKSQLTGPVIVAAQDIHSDSSVPLHNLGEYVHSNDGRGFRYCQAGSSTALVAGMVQQAPAEDTTNHQGLSAGTSSIGDLTVSITSTPTLSANDLQGGFMSVTDGTLGLGFTYKIKSHLAAAAAAFTLNLEDPIVVATTGTVVVDLTSNPYKDVIIAPDTTETSSPVGFAVYNITKSYYGWLCVHGPTTCLCEGTITVGDDIVVAGASVAGTVAEASATTLSRRCGYAITGITDGEYGLMYAQID